MKKILLFLTSLILSVNWAYGGAITQKINGITYKWESTNGNEGHGAFHAEGWHVDEVATEATSVTIPDTINYKVNDKKYAVIAINSEKFSGKTNLQSITLPKTLKFINEYAFKGCTSLTSITLPESMEKITNVNDRGLCFNAFEGCTNLTTLTINSDTLARSTQKDLNFADIFPSVKKVTFGGEAFIVGIYAFYRSKADCPLQEVCLEGKDKSVRCQFIIRDNAFKNCKQLTTVQFPDSVQYIGDYSFEDCSELKNVNLPYPNGFVHSIDACAFQNCTSLQTIKIPSGIYTIGKTGWTLCPNAFNGCTNLTTVYINNNNIASKNYGGADANIADVFPNCTNLVFGPNVQSIGEKACFKSDGDANIVSVDCGNATYIDKQAFYYCKKLKNIEFGPVETVDNEAFIGCSGLESLDFATNGPNVTTLGVSAFEGCTSLKTLNLGNVGTLYAKAFKGCTALNSVDLGNLTSANTETNNKSFLGCSALHNIDLKKLSSDGCFDFKYLNRTVTISTTNTQHINNPNFEQLVLGPDITVFQNKDASTKLFDASTVYNLQFIEFQNTDGVTINMPLYNASLPNLWQVDGKIVEVKAYCFSELKGLTKVNLDNCTTIGTRAFAGCTSLTNLSTKKEAETLEFL